MFECVWVKEKRQREGGRGDEAMSPGGIPPCGELRAWALKGLKVSGVPSPPRTDREGPSARRTGEDEGGRGVAGLEAGCLALMVVGEVGLKGVCGGVQRGGRVNYGF